MDARSIIRYSAFLGTYDAILYPLYQILVVEGARSPIIYSIFLFISMFGKATILSILRFKRKEIVSAQITLYILLLLVITILLLNKGPIIMIAVLMHHYAIMNAYLAFYENVPDKKLLARFEFYLTVFRFTGYLIALFVLKMLKVSISSFLEILLIIAGIYTIYNLITLKHEGILTFVEEISEKIEEEEEKVAKIFREIHMHHLDIHASRYIEFLIPEDGKEVFISALLFNVASKIVLSAFSYIVISALGVGYYLYVIVSQIVAMFVKYYSNKLTTYHLFKYSRLPRIFVPLIIKLGEYSPLIAIPLFALFMVPTYFIYTLYINMGLSLLGRGQEISAIESFRSIGNAIGSILSGFLLSMGLIPLAIVYYIFLILSMIIDRNSEMLNKIRSLKDLG